MSDSFFRPGFVGLGGAGRSIAIAFESLGCPVFVLDLFPSALNGRPGVALGLSGSNQSYSIEDVRRRLEEKSDKIRAELSHWAQENDLDCLALCAGLGGRTGSSVDVVVRALSGLGPARLVLGALPESYDRPYAKARAVRALSWIADAGPDALILEDNDQIPTVLSASTVASDYTVANALLAKQFDDANAMLERPGSACLRPVPRDLLWPAVTSGCLLTFGSVTVEVFRGQLDLETLVQSVRGFLRSPGLLVPVDEAPKATFVLAVLESQSKLFESLSHEFIRDFGNKLSAITGGYSCIGAFSRQGGEDVQCDLLICHSGLPGRVEAFMRQAASEARALRQRIRLTVPFVEPEDLKGIEAMAAEAAPSLEPLVEESELLGQLHADLDVQEPAPSVERVIPFYEPPAPAPSVERVMPFSEPPAPAPSVERVIPFSEPSAPAPHAPEPEPEDEKILEEVPQGSLDEDLALELVSEPSIEDLTSDEPAPSLVGEDAFTETSEEEASVSADVKEEDFREAPPVHIPAEPSEPEASVLAAHEPPSPPLAEGDLEPEASFKPEKPEPPLLSEFVPIAADLDPAKPMEVRRKAVSFVLRKLKDPESSVRIQALQLLGGAEGFRIWPKVTEMLQDPSEEVRALAQEILRKVPQ